MELTGKHVIPADVHAVWRSLIDPDVLQACIPGCEEVTKVSEVEFTAKVQVKIGPVSARFEGKGTLTEMAPPYRCTIVGEGQGGAAGFAKGIVMVTLEPEPGQATVLTYSARSQVSGKIAQLGSRLIDGVARKLADVFFSRLVEQVSAKTDHAGSAQAIEPQAPAGGASEPPSADSFEQWYGRPLLLM
jgi:carbon monoxide dehydrogenase subunit G